MYDFCFTFPYAMLLGLGGLMGFLSKGSMMSLYGGVGSACLLSLSGYVSLQYYHRGKTCKAATLGALVIASALTVVMYRRYASSGKIFPAGVTMFLSGAMAVFYVWSIMYGPAPAKIKEVQ
eukprot:evm.model.scf_638.4 EVM.evm.TU.scf_638.4   scf_638:35993-36355(+)